MFRHGFVLTGAGLVVGFAGAAAFTRWLETLLFNTSPADSTAWLAMVAVVILSTAAACAAPARRAASASPTSALGAEWAGSSPADLAESEREFVAEAWIGVGAR